MKEKRERNRPLWLQVCTGVSVMALLVLTAFGNALLMLLVALALLIGGFMIFGREMGRPGAWAAILGIITASSIVLLWLLWPR
jgi:hypothetical protein